MDYFKKKDLSTLLNYESLFNLMNSIYPMSDGLKDAVVKNSEVIYAKRKSRLLNANEKGNTMYFIVNGSARVYYLNKEGTEINNWFLFENELVISVYSFYTGESSLEYIEMLEDSVLIAIKRTKLEEMYIHFLDFNYIGRKLTEIYHLRNEIKSNNLRMFNARERYESLLEMNPEIFKRVPQKHIASYLGISPECVFREYYPYQYVPSCSVGSMDL